MHDLPRDPAENARIKALHERFRAAGVPEAHAIMWAVAIEGATR